MSAKTNSRNNIIPFPRSSKERLRILRESKDPRVRICHLLRMVFGWFLTVGIVLFLVGNYRLFSPSNISSIFRYAVSGLLKTQGDLTTIAFENGSASDAELFGTGLAYASEDTLYAARAGGRVSLSETLGYSTPVLKTTEDYILAFDRGGNKVCLANAFSKIAEITLPSPIITGDIAKNGSFTLVTDEQGYRTSAAVYDTRGKEVFKWNSSEYYIVSTALSPDAKTLYALAFQQDGIAMNSYVFLFSVSSGEKFAEVSLPDSLGSQIVNLSSDYSVAFCDNGVYLIDQKGNIKFSQAFVPSDLLAFASSKQTFAFALRSYGGEARSDIYVIRTNGKVSGPISIQEEPSSLAVSKGGVATLSTDGVSVYGSALESQWKNNEAAGANRILISDDGTVFAIFHRNTRLFTSTSTRSESIQNAV